MNQESKSTSPSCDLSVILPAYNEETTISRVIQSILQHLDNTGLRGEVIVVDDGSTDATTRNCKELSNRDNRVILLLNESNNGKGYSVRRGVEVARGERIGFMDADLSYPIGQVEPYLIKLDESFDLAIGCRRLPESVFSLHPNYFPYIYIRHIIGLIFNLITRWLVPVGCSDTQCGFKFFTCRAAKEIFSRSLMCDFSFDVEILFLARRLGYRIAQLPVNYRYFRQHSSVSLLRDSIRMIKQLLKIRQNYRAGLYRTPSCEITGLPGDYQHRALHEGSLIQRRWHANKLRFMEHIVKIEASDVILDAGCGSGLLINTLSERCRLACGVDISQEMVNFASSSLARQNTIFVCADLGRLPFQNNIFSKIFCVEVIEHLPHRDIMRIIYEFDRTLKPGGRIFFTTPNYGSIWSIIEKMTNAVKMFRGIERDKHITHFSFFSLRSLISSPHYFLEIYGSINHLSPFIALLSRKWSERAFLWESRPGRRMGNLLYAVFRKEKFGEKEATPEVISTS